MNEPQPGHLPMTRTAATPQLGTEISENSVGTFVSLWNPNSCNLRKLAACRSL